MSGNAEHMCWANSQLGGVLPWWSFSFHAMTWDEQRWGDGYQGNYVIVQACMILTWFLFIYLLEWLICQRPGAENDQISVTRSVFQTSHLNLIIQNQLAVQMPCFIWFYVQWELRIFFYFNAWHMLMLNIWNVPSLINVLTEAYNPLENYSIF